jgi:hypothetical protein
MSLLSGTVVLNLILCKSSLAQSNALARHLSTMDSEAKQAFVRRVAKENQSDPEGIRILWSRHAVAELAIEGWNRRQIEGALLGSEVIEDYPTLHRPLPDCLVLAWVTSVIPVHVVVAIDPNLDRILLVTVYRPSEEEWEDDWKTRK